MMDLDKTARERIRSDINTNFFVEAGAGSGKTSVLVDRMVSMVEGGLDISKICAITFTKVAANEFYARFHKKLAESGSERAKEALKNIDLCFMGTIDSFCNMVLSEHPAEAGIPSDASIISADEMNALYIRELSLISNGERGTALQEKCSRFKNNFYDADEIFIKGLSRVMGSRNAHFNYVKPDGRKPDEVFREERNRIIPILQYLHDHPEALETEKPKDAFEAYGVLTNEYSMLIGSWNESLETILRNLARLKGLRVVKEYDVSLIGPDFDSIFIQHETRGKPGWYEVRKDDGDDPFAVTKIKNLLFSIAMDFISDAAEVISSELRKEGKLGFFDYLLYLRDLLRDDAKNGGGLAQHIYNRHSYFLVDEFQDTNPIQAEVFFYLAAKNSCVDWVQCVPKEGSLFIVGDPKQSIYRFQNADVASFLRVRNLFENPEVGEVLNLTRNFRSSDNMCKWFNDAFSVLLPDDTQSQSKFDPIPTGEKPAYTATLEGVYKYSFDYSRKIDDSEEFRTVADIILKLVSDPDITVLDRGEDNLPRRICFKDIMLITPGKTHLEFFLKEFIARDIPFKVEGKVLFSECPALKSVSTVLQAVADPFDAKARFAAEKLSDLDITEEKIFSYASKARQMSPAAVFSMIMDEEIVFARSGADNAEYIYFALELLRSGEASGNIFSIKDGAAFVAGLVNNESEKERCIQLVRDDNRVHIANLHKVKGLEAPVVILADPRGKQHKPYDRVDYSKNPPESFIFALSDTVTSTEYADERAQEEEALTAESTRLLYVAATRAADALIIADIIDKEGNSKDDNPWYRLLSAADKDILEELASVPLPKPTEKVIRSADELYEKAESVLTGRCSEGPSYQIMVPSQMKLESVISSDGNPENSLEESKRKYSSKQNPALIGTIVHRLMEVLVSSKGKTKLDELIGEIARDYDADEEYFKNILNMVGNTMLNGGYVQEFGATQDIFEELLAADEVYTEVPFCYSADNDGIVNGVIDVIYLKDNEWHIIDYKTDAEFDSEGLKHKAQLDAYIKAFRQITGKTADAKIYQIKI